MLLKQVLKKAQSAIESRIRAAHDWLDDGRALRGGVGEKSLRQIIEQAERLSDRYLAPAQAEPLAKLASQIATMTDALCELRQNEKGFVFIQKIIFLINYSYIILQMSNRCRMYATGGGFGSWSKRQVERASIVDRFRSRSC